MVFELAAALAAMFIASSRLFAADAGAVAADKAFEEAVMSGRPLAAEREFRKLEETRVKLPPDRYFQAAEVSRQLGKSADRRTRLAHYIRVAKNFDDTVEQAAWELSTRHDDVDAFELLVSKLGKSQLVFSEAMRLLDSLRQKKRGPEFVRAIDAALAVFKGEDEVAKLLRRFSDAAAEGATSQSDDAIRFFMEQHKCRDLTVFDRVLMQRRQLFSPIWKLRLMQSAGGLPSPDVLSSSVEVADGDRAEAAKISKWMAPLVLDGTHGKLAYHWMRLRLNVRGELFTGGQTNEMSKAFLADFGKVADSKEGYGRGDLCNLSRMVAERTLNHADRAALRDKYPQFVPADVAGSIFGLSAACDAAKSTRPYRDFAAKYPDPNELRYQMLTVIAKHGDEAEVEECLYTQLLVGGNYGYDRSWRQYSYEHLLRALSVCPKTADGRAKMITRLVEKTGAHPFWKWCREHGPAKTNPAMTNDVIKAALAKSVDGLKSNDRLVEISREIRALGREGKENKAPEAAHRLFDEASRVLPGKWPQKGTRSIVFREILTRYVWLSIGNSSSATNAAKAILAKIDAKDKSAVDTVFTEHFRIACRGSAETMSDWARATGRASFLAETYLPKETKQLPVPLDAFADSSEWTQMMFIERNCCAQKPSDRRLTADTARSVVATAFKSLNCGKMNQDWFCRLLCSAASLVAWEDQAAAAAAFPLDKTASELFVDDMNIARVLSFLGVCRACGKLDHVLPKLYAVLDKMTPERRIGFLVALGQVPEVTNYPDEAKKVPDRFGPVFDKALATLKAIPTKHAVKTWLGNSYASFGWRSSEWTGKFAPGAKDAAKARLDELLGHVERLREAGAFIDGDGFGKHMSIYCCNALRNALDATNAVALARVARDFGASTTQQSLSPDSALAYMDRIRKQEMWEALYLCSSSMRPENAKSVVDAASRFRAEASTHLQGVYPVSEKDPLYPLYVAADEQGRNNFERATELLKANLQAFERGADKLPPAFVAWGIDQMRVMRGDKDALLIRARELATKLLGDESKLTPEFAAAMLLVRAETFRDQQNFEAAKLEYQTIRNNLAYSKTPSGRRAMFRSVDMMIESGNASAAEPTLEYWLSQPDSEVQAQAHYFLALIAFERKDYEECVKQLKEVFAIDYTHTEARFLQGRWKLATNSEVDETEVVVGSISDRTALRPGQPLSITVQDRNLSVAGGGSSIPVVVVSDPGGDFEIVQLMPSVRDPGLFRGVVDVKLAAPVASNGVLEVSGRDTVSYEIDRDFLAARGLDQGAAKKLLVVDDARLAVGSGAPRVDDADSAAQVEALVDEAASADGSLLARSLRPGNPLHIAISDKDRSPGTDDGVVTVSVSTTSGDRMDNVELKETRPYSGVFRATVRTALPAPRAYASDTAVGFNPGDVINSRRDGSWKSLADSQPVKWFAVDTMGSHLVSNAVVAMKAPEDVTALRLTGRLGGETVNLGSFPAADAKSREGLRLQVEMRHMQRSESVLRDFMESASAPKSSSVTNLAFRNDRYCTARFSGYFTAPSDVNFAQLRVVPSAASDNAIKSLWLVVALDGKTVMAGYGQGLSKASIPLELTIGVHRLEVFAMSCGANDAFSLVCVSPDGSTSPMPMEWFDAEAHPELRAAVADRAQIVRDATGFVATFPEPVRLRTLRWDFLGRRSPDVTIDSVTAIDSEGNAILPVESDFSDSQDNDTLEVAPGDRISVSYADDRTTRGVRRKVEKSMVSSFTDAKVGFFFEGVTEPGATETRLYGAYRFVPGDSIVVSVEDSDLDATDEADTVEVVVKTRSGRETTLSLVEQRSERQIDDEGGVHTGRFLGLLRTAAEGSDGADKAIEAADNDELKLEYLDRENTRPGVPSVRTAKLPATRRAEPVVTLFRATTERVPDESPLAKARLSAIRRRPGNDDVGKIMTTKAFAEAMDPSQADGDEEIVMNIDAPVLVRVGDPSRARHSGSFLTLEAETDTDTASSSMRIGGGFVGVSLRSGAESWNSALQNGSFNGMVRLHVGTAETVAAAEDAMGRQFDREHNLLPVTGTDKVLLRVKDGDEVVAERRISFAADATLDLVDSSLAAERKSVHCGERLYVKVRDSDQDTSDEADTVEVEVRGLLSNASRKLSLVETMPHSGVFSGSVTPVMALPQAAKGGESAAKAGEKAAGQEDGEVDGGEAPVDDTLPVRFGDSVEFVYVDARPFSSETARTLCATGLVHKGSDGALRVFSKRFSDVDQAVLVQFRLAECLFEQAKDYRARKQGEKSSEAIARGRFILEEALKGNPGTVHAAQGEFLLANLSQELAAESKDNGDEETSRRLYTEALTRFSALLAASPQGDYAARAQYHKALCLEMLGDFRRAGEEYVKMTYLYPESDLVGDAAVRLATHYYKNEKRYEVAARVYENFQRRFPNHSKASRALFMSGSCFVKEADAVQLKYAEGHAGLSPKADKLYLRAVKAFENMAETYRSERPEMRAQALYWAGDTSLKRQGWKDAYLFLKRTVLEYPETEWARRARGLLVRESDRFGKME